MKQAHLFILILMIGVSFGVRQLYMYGQEKAQRNATVIIGFMGDVMLGRLVNEQLLANKNMRYPWGNMISELHSTDLNIMNMEFALTKSEQIVPKVFNFKSDPAHIKVLQEGHIDVVNLANNHTLDFDVEGLQETVNILDAVGIKHVGAGMTRTEVLAPVIIERNGIKIGIVGATDNEPGWIAQADKPGVNYIEVGDIDSVKRLIETVRSQVDLLILTMHWGPNMRQRPTLDFIQFAHHIIDAGVDIFHGHSAHVFQAVERYHGGLIMFDTGDFVDDYAVDPKLRNDRSFFFKVTVNAAGFVSLQLVPVLISNMQVNHAPQSDAREMVALMQVLSAEQGTLASEISYK